MRNFLNKHKFIRVYTFMNDKTLKVEYHKKDTFKPAFLINSNHIFISNGYTCIVTNESSPETINPLDFTSKYPANKFKTAIKTKLLNDTFNGLKTEKIDVMKVALFANLFVTIILLFMLLKSNGVV